MIFVCCCAQLPFGEDPKGIIRTVESSHDSRAPQEPDLHFPRRNPPLLLAHLYVLRSSTTFLGRDEYSSNWFWFLLEIIYDTKDKISSQQWMRNHLRFPGERLLLLYAPHDAEDHADPCINCTHMGPE